VRHEPRCLLLSPVLQEPFRSSREAQYPKDRGPCKTSGDQCSQSDEISVSSPAHTLSLFPGCVSWRWHVIHALCRVIGHTTSWLQGSCAALFAFAFAMEAGSILENLSCSLWSSSHHEVDLNGPSKIVCLIRCKVVCRQRFFRSVVAEVYASDACSMICTVRGLAPGGFFYHHDGRRSRMRSCGVAHGNSLAVGCRVVLAAALRRQVRELELRLATVLPHCSRGCLLMAGLEPLYRLQWCRGQASLVIWDYTTGHARYR
jgi:hypothetical protein